MLFGTDGVRGLATDILNNSIAYKLGRATASLKKNATIAVAFDTRLSGRAIEAQFIEGAVESGGRVIECGLLPTPALAYVTYLTGADYGAMISASHNPPEYNGVKIFDGGGNKISLETENYIEDIFTGGRFAVGEGDLRDGTAYRKNYVERIVNEVDCDLNGMPITLDCCFGATAGIAPKIFKKLNAKVTALCNNRNGKLVNVYSGATNIDYLKHNTKSELGFSFDGDGDRVLGVDNGQILDGDCMLYFLAREWLKRNLLIPKIVVGTKMTNIRLGEVFENHGINLLRADVGDKFVLEIMKKTGAVLGGEQAGHIIIKNEIATGDGILAAAMMSKFKSEGVRFNDYRPYPQIQNNYRIDKKILTKVDFLEELKKIEQKLNGNGRILIRPSGTEPLIRVLVEGKNIETIKNISMLIEGAIRKFGNSIENN